MKHETEAQTQRIQDRFHDLLEAVVSGQGGIVVQPLKPGETILQGFTVTPFPAVKKTDGEG